MYYENTLFFMWLKNLNRPKKQQKVGYETIWFFMSDFVTYCQ